MKYYLVLAAGLLCSYPASALQTQTCPIPHQGPASGLAFALSVESELAVGATTRDDGVLLKEAGSQTTPPSPINTQLYQSSAPSYALTSLFGADYAGRIDINAMSTGRDYVPDHEGGIPNLGATSWMTVTVSFKSGPAGIFENFAPSSLPAKRLSGCLSNSATTFLGADLYSYYYDNAGTGLPSNLIGADVIDQRVERIAYDAASGYETIDSLDFNLGVVQQAGPLPQGVNRVFFDDEIPETFYFSISAECVADLNAGTPPTHWGPPSTTLFASSGGVQTPAVASSIYLSTWDDATGQWGQPEELYTHADLGEFVGAADDIDALAMNDKTETNRTFVFSVAQELDLSLPTKPQLLIHTDLVGTAELLNLNGDKVIEEIAGAGDDPAGGDLRNDVGSLCDIEPEYDPNSPAQGMGRVMGLPLSTLPTVLLPPTGNTSTEPLGLSVTRRMFEPGSGAPAVKQIVVQASGWGDGSPNLSVSQLYYSSDLGQTWGAIGTTVPRQNGGPHDEIVEWAFLDPDMGGAQGEHTFAVLNLELSSSLLYSVSWAAGIEY